MLIPHHPSPHLRPPRYRSPERNQDLADVHITVVAAPPESPTPAATGLATGRMAALNRRPPA